MQAARLACQTAPGLVASASTRSGTHAARDVAACRDANLVLLQAQWPMRDSEPDWWEEEGTSEMHNCARAV